MPAFYVAANFFCFIFLYFFSNAPLLLIGILNWTFLLPPTACSFFYRPKQDQRQIPQCLKLVLPISQPFPHIHYPASPASTSGPWYPQHQQPQITKEPKVSDLCYQTSVSIRVVGGIACAVGCFQLLHSVWPVPCQSTASSKLCYGVGTCDQCGCHRDNMILQTLEVQKHGYLLWNPAQADAVTFSSPCHG